MLILQEYGQKNQLVGVFDVPLTGVGALWQTDGTPTRRRRLLPRSDVPVKCKGLQIVCKVNVIYIFLLFILLTPLPISLISIGKVIIYSVHSFQFHFHTVQPILHPKIGS